ncbi:MAG: hypothetical protein ACH346_02815 [Chthoniobacterales bacterium]
MNIFLLPGWEAHLGLQLEYLLLQNRPLLLKAIGLSPTEVLCDGPYRQSKRTIQKGCQIDYLIQTQTRNLFINEFKFKKRELTTDVINQVQEKIQALKIPRGFAAIPVLFHIGGVSSGVATDPYFFRVIDIASFLEEIEVSYSQ